MENKPVFMFGKCNSCGRNAPLKNGYCLRCDAKRGELPDCFKDLFGGFNKWVILRTINMIGSMRKTNLLVFKCKKTAIVELW